MVRPIRHKRGTKNDYRKTRTYVEIAVTEWLKRRHVFVKVCIVHSVYTEEAEMNNLGSLTFFL